MKLSLKIGTKNLLFKIHDYRNWLIEKITHFVNQQKVKING